MRIIKKREHGTRISYWLAYEYTDGRSGGFAFDCDKDGNLTNQNPCAKSNLAKCQNGELPVRCLGVQKITTHYTTPAIGICDNCDEELPLTGFTNTCTCGADYNSAGQHLAPRSQWGEETGESLGEIMRIK